MQQLASLATAPLGRQLSNDLINVKTKQIHAFHKMIKISQSNFNYPHLVLSIFPRQFQEGVAPYLFFYGQICTLPVFSMTKNAPSPFFAAIYACLFHHNSKMALSFIKIEHHLEFFTHPWLEV